MSEAAAKSVVRSDIVFTQKDKALRDDVRRLGHLVGQLVEEQGGEALFDLVEAARRAAIAHREGDDEAAGRLRSLIAELAPQTAADFIRAFSTYFQMVNLAEKVHRIRRRRAYLKDSKTPQPYSVLDILQRLHDQGVDREDVQQALERVQLLPVFTSHSTQVTRRTLLRKEHNIAKSLVRMLDPYLTPQETAAILGQIRLDMTTGWQTEDLAEEKQLADEAEHVLFFLTDVLFRVIPPFYESIEGAMESVYESEARPIRVPVLVHFGSWIGGDLDGHPNVTGKSIRATLSRHRALVLDLYFRECNDLAGHLSQSESRVAVSGELRDRIELYASHFPKAAHSVPSRHRKMPYRVFLRLVAARLSATYEDAAFPYESSEEFIADLELIAASLRANRGRHAGLFALNRLLRRAQTFGFHMATLDIRQSADVHSRVVAEGLVESDWKEFMSARATVRIKEALKRRESPARTLSSEARRSLAVFQAIAHCRRKYGDLAIGPYIVSKATGPEDVLSVLLLARWGHLGPKNQDVPLDIAPLFETVDDLENASEIMARLLSDERYRNHLRARGDRQIVMIGYADSNHGGAVSACFSVHKAQLALRETAKRFGVALTVFHGRGGTMNRAGGRINDAIVATMEGESPTPLRMTEAGERISAKYGLRGIAIRTLEQTVGSLLEVAAQPHVPDPRTPEWTELMGVIAEGSRDTYKRLVDAGDDFEDYYRAATPIDVIDNLNIITERDREDEDYSAYARARRWEFAWVQNRCLMPAWYGFASGVAHALDRAGEEEIRRMFEAWPFARVLIADIEQSLAKVDIAIARRYSELAGDSLHEKYFPRIRAEFEKSIELMLRLTNQSQLLESAPTIRRAIRLRNPYVDPMSLLQIDLLRRWRESGCEDDAILNALRSSINGIAHGMQDTG